VIWAFSLLVSVGLLMLAGKLFLSYSTPYTKAPTGPYALARSERDPNQRCAVYVYPGPIGTNSTIYVGSSIDPPEREKIHKTDWWWPLVTRARREDWFNTIPEAEAREKELIALLLPTGNLRDKPKGKVRAG
jgi:hypothetical protein